MSGLYRTKVKSIKSLTVLIQEKAFTNRKPIGIQASIFAITDSTTIKPHRTIWQLINIFSVHSDLRSDAWLLRYHFWVVKIVKNRYVFGTFGQLEIFNLPLDQMTKSKMWIWLRLCSQRLWPDYGVRWCMRITNHVSVGIPGLNEQRSSRNRD